MKKIEAEEETYYKKHKKGIRNKKEFYPEPQRSVAPTPMMSQAQPRQQAPPPPEAIEELPHEENLKQSYSKPETSGFRVDEHPTRN